MLKSIKFSTVFILLLIVYNTTQAQSQGVPGIVVKHIPAKTGVYIGSPAICILPNGDYVASHDHFGPKSTEHERAVSAVYKSTNKGKFWKNTVFSMWTGSLTAVILFFFQGQLIMMNMEVHTIIMMLIFLRFIELGISENSED